MKIIGVTGGVGSGKSAVLTVLEEKYGAYVCQLYVVAKELQKPGSTCFKKIVALFGRKILREDGELDRQKLSREVFGNQEKLKRLNEIVHPEVKAWVLTDIARREKEGRKLYVMEAALLLEAGYETVCDEIWYIYVPKEIRIKRLQESRGYTRAKTEKIAAAQLDEEIFRERCTAVIDNSGTFENTERQIGDRVL
jgi:dephospho-CoA kinase